MLRSLESVAFSGYCGLLVLGEGEVKQTQIGGPFTDCPLAEGDDVQWSPVPVERSIHHRVVVFRVHESPVPPQVKREEKKTETGGDGEGNGSRDVTKRGGGGGGSGGGRPLEVLGP